MTKLIDDVYKFNKEIIKTEQPKVFSVLNKDRLLFAVTALYEELYEFTKASNCGDVGESLDAIIDLIYFAIGRAYEMGITKEQFIKCWDVVQEKNMQKKKGTKNRGTDIDAIKPQGWKAADLGELLK